ncbi:MAG: amidase [Microvirga sp.]
MTSVRDRLDATLDRIEGGRSGKHVFMKLYPDAARAAADAADARKRAGITLGPLDGALVSIKDLFDVAGEPTTAGSKLRRDAAPAAADAPVVARLRRAGAVILAKTNMVEFAFGGIGLNPHHGTPGSAADPSRVPGGSTSGGAVSVGEGTSDITIGSDTGGSTRIPAAFNGVVGFKPTARRVPLEGAFPLSYALDSIGPLARTVQQCADADAVMAGEEPRPLGRRALAGLRIGVPRGRLFQDTDAVVAAAFEASLGRLSAAGARVAEHDIEDLLAGLAEATAPASLAAVEAAEVHKDWLESRAAEFDPRVQTRILRGAAIPAATYIRMLRRRAALAAALDARLAAVDVLALPTVPVVPPPIAPLIADDDLYMRTNLLVLRNTMIANFFDLTSISLPIPGTALPVGFMLIARNGRDRDLLAIAAAVEAELAPG